MSATFPLRASLRDRLKAPKRGGRWPSERSFDKTHVGVTKDFGKHDSCTLCGSPTPGLCKGCGNLVEYAAWTARKVVGIAAEEDEPVDLEAVCEWLTTNQMVAYETESKDGTITEHFLRDLEVTKRVIFLEQFRDAVRRFTEADAPAIQPTQPALTGIDTAGFVKIRIEKGRRGQPAKAAANPWSGRVRQEA